MRRLVWWAPPLLAASVVAYLAMVPPYASIRETMTGTPHTASTPDRIVISRVGSAPLRESVPPLPVLIPVVLSALPLIGRDAASRRKIGFAAASVLGVFCLLASFSIGLFFVPSLLLMVSAMLIDKPVHDTQLPREATT